MPKVINQTSFNFEPGTARKVDGRMQF